MRTLSFKVRGQVLNKDPTCDFSNIIEGSEGYLQVHFDFNKDWDGLRKVIEFIYKGKSGFVVLDNDTCMIPSIVTKAHFFHIRVHGAKEDFRIATNKVLIVQER